MSIRADSRSFRDDQTRGSALRIIVRIQSGRHVAGPARILVSGAMMIRLGSLIAPSCRGVKSADIWLVSVRYMSVIAPMSMATSNGSFTSW